MPVGCVPYNEHHGPVCVCACVVCIHIYLYITYISISYNNRLVNRKQAPCTFELRDNCQLLLPSRPGFVVEVTELSLRPIKLRERTSRSCYVYIAISYNNINNMQINDDILKTLLHPSPKWPQGYIYAPLSLVVVLYLLTPPTTAIAHCPLAP